MANLVPLHIDKDSGRIVARGFGVGVGTVARGYLYEQITTSATWVISHNRSNDLVLVQVYDEVGELTSPDKVLIVDINTVTITFGSPMAGTAHILFFSTV